MCRRTDHSVVYSKRDPLRRRKRRKNDIEAKLSVICFHNKVSFNEQNENKPAPTTYNLNEVSGADDAIPAWVKAVLDTQKSM